MRVGIITPVNLLLPRSHNEWEVEATVDDLVTVARAADRLGYHHLTASEHVAIPADVEARRGKRYWDLVATLSFLAAHTDRIGLMTNIVVLPYHHPVQVLKRYGTVDLLSKGRLLLGVGVGTLASEFDLLGIEMTGRGDRADDAIRCLQANWGNRSPSWSGPHWAFDDIEVDPAGIERRLPVWVGGRTRRSLRRAVELGDGWMPFLLGIDEVAEMLAWARRLPAWTERDRPLEVLLWPEPAVDPVNDADRILEQREEYRSKGATMFNERFVSHGVAHHVEQMEAYAELVELEPPRGSPA